MSDNMLSDDPQSPSDCDEADNNEKMLTESGSEIGSPSDSSDRPMPAAEDMDDCVSVASSSADNAQNVEEGRDDEDTPMSPDAEKSDQEPDTTQLLERVDSSSECGDTSNSPEPREEDNAKGENIEEDGDGALTAPEIAIREATPASPDELPEDFVPYRGENDGGVPHGALDHHEGELDFEEEVNEERREETDSVGEVEKPADDEVFYAKKEEGELAKDDKKEDEDDGEVEDDDDLEEGEVKESSSGRKMQPKPICRFFNKGQCTWGTSCRFLHPGINDKGNYNMFAPTRTSSSGNGAGHGDWQGNGQRVSPTFIGRGFAEALLIPPPHEELPQYESAWERGLRHAKEILKKSSKRKESEPDFEDKRLNLSSGGGNDSLIDYEKENDYYGKGQNPYVRNDNYGTYGSATFDDGYMDPYDRQAHEYWRGGNYENFEVRYTRTEHDYRVRDKFRTPDRERERTRPAPREREREPVYKERDREKERNRRDNKLERVERQRTPDRNWRDSRMPEMHNSRSRGDEWRDPWRRCDHTLSTTPKRRGGSRSFSSHSSASYSSSSRSRRSSSYSSYSGSSSGSSYSSYSSPPHSPSRGKTSQRRKEAHPPLAVEARKKCKQVPNKHPAQPPKPMRPPSRQAPPAPALAPTAAPTQPPLVIDKKKLIEKQQPPRVAAHLEKSAHSSKKSLKSENLPPRARSPTPSESDSESTGSESSHSFSSVSSASSRSSHSSKSYRKDMRMKAIDHNDDKKIKQVISRKFPRETLKRQPSDKQRMKLEHSLSGKVRSSMNQSRVEQLFEGASKDPLKQSGHKQQIKLTLLNKPVEKAQMPAVSPPKKESVKKDTIIERKPKLQPPPLPAALIEPKAIDVKSIPVPSGSSRKRPLSPLTQADTTTVSKHQTAGSGTGPKQSPAVSSSTSKKSSTSSRREELLKQLKAIEDAIARKRAKPS